MDIGHFSLNGIFSEQAKRFPKLDLIDKWSNRTAKRRQPATTLNISLEAVGRYQLHGN